MAGEADDGTLSLTGWAVPEGLASLHALLEQGREAHSEIDPEAFMMLETAVVELANNVVEHGRPRGELRWTFTLRVLPGLLEGVLADDGQEYDGDLDAAMPDPLAESGRGIALAQAALDELLLEREDGHNVWTMRRRY
ncbi:ATP-binding protein [Nocardioides solisilvae]|uniref:ATP-binding protein n=1 Tax=Nocardioides solisilvae TaxID=1542435 RepID=UPI000D746418|nr:ATP-binding protein [Nocardioides solisilvae]